MDAGRRVSDTSAPDPASFHRLNDGSRLAPIGLGTAPMSDVDTEDAVRDAISIGYRLIDTGAIYGNEAGVGRGLKTSTTAADDVSVLTKIRGRDQGYDEALAAFEASRERLDVEVVDLLLIHWPIPQLDRYLDTWRAMIQLQRDGRVRSIGVSNFLEPHLRRLADETGVLPAVNQIEVHPGFPQPELREVNRSLGVQTLCYSPLGHSGALLTDPALLELAATHGKSVAQVILRWHVQHDLVPLPRASSTARRRENFDVFDFTLEDQEMRAIDQAFTPKRTGWDPATREEL